MIKAYLASISTQYEGEKIEVRYRIYDGDEQIVKKSVMINYIKPLLVGHAAMITLLRELEKMRDREIVIYINDGALYETINGTSGTKNYRLIEKAKDTRKEMRKFPNLEIINVNGNHERLVEWDEILKP